MSYTLSSAQVSYLSSLIANGPDASGIHQGTYRTLYTAIIEMVTDDYGLATASPKAGVENSVWLWLNGARDVNSGVGYFSDYIRMYTEKQYLLRTGEVLDSSAIQDTSNVIALAVANQIISDNGLIPDILTIGEDDAGSIAAGIFLDNYSGWAGTLLFPFLGVGDFTRDWLFSLNATDQKPLSGTYDLVTAAAVSRDIAESWENFASFISNEIFGEGIGHTVSNNNIGEANTEALLANLRNEANNVFQLAYGLPDQGRFQIGGDLPLYSTALSLESLDFLFSPLASVGNCAIPF